MIKVYTKLLSTFSSSLEEKSNSMQKCETIIKILYKFSYTKQDFLNYEASNIKSTHFIFVLVKISDIQ
jgi:hypothetical protein